MTTPSSVLVVGASAAGLGTVQALRSKGYRGTVTLVGAELHPPYERPPLSKRVLPGTWEPERSHLRAASTLSDADTEFVLADPATGLDAANRTVHTASGRSLRTDAVVLARACGPARSPARPTSRGSTYCAPSTMR